MRVEDVKQWLHGIKLEEDTKSEMGNVNAWDNWRLFLKLVQAVWDHRDTPPQLLWVIVVLIPKGSGNYWGIGLLGPMWKVCECVMDKRLIKIDLHKSLHDCRDRCSTGTAMIKAKLAQQLSHLEQVPFYGVSLDLKNAFSAMNCECCLLILEGYGVGPKMIRLTWIFVCECNDGMPCIC
jgi:hypothetical protein